MTSGISTERFRPTRCGIINLWDYRDEEFVFADGRMVLRGPNGSGKTKALEVLFPFIFDGRIEPRRLNPFAGVERTMKSNLLYRGQDSALGYVWMEFRRGPTPAQPDGAAVTVGVGLRAQRQAERPTRWYFVADGQVGRDFSLLGPDDRPLTKKQLTQEIGADAVVDGPGDHRRAVDTKLFGFGADRFEQLLTLVLTLRRPQLAQSLDPKGLSQALSDGLRPLDSALIDEAAHSFGDMESVQRTLAGLVQADLAAGAFLAGYTTYIRTHARSAADGITQRLEVVRGQRNDLAAAGDAAAAADAERAEADSRRTDADSRRGVLQARLDSLKASAAYQDREQLGRLRDVTADLARAAVAAAAEATKAATQLSRRIQARQDAVTAHSTAVAALARAVGEVQDAAAESGIEWTAADSADDGLLSQRALARTTARQDDVAAVRTALLALTQARDLRDRALRALDSARERLAAAEDTAAAAGQELVATVAALREAASAWIGRHTPLLTELPSDAGNSADEPAISDPGVANPDPVNPDPTSADPVDPGQWLNDLEHALHQGIETVGEPEAEGLTTVLDRQLFEPLELLRERIRDGRAAQQVVEREIAAVSAERAEIAAERDQAPPPAQGRTAERDPATGAPLWALVDFRDDVDPAEAAQLEAALIGANLLDAWVAVTPPDSATPGISETFLLPLAKVDRPKGPTLADVLIPELTGPVPTDTVAQVLASVALLAPGAKPTRSGVGLTRAGGYRQGIQLGGHTKDAVEYIGATARTRRRLQRLADLDIRLMALQVRFDQLGAVRKRRQDMLTGLDQARKSLPGTASVTAALRKVDVTEATRSALAAATDRARDEYDTALSATGLAEQALRSTAAARRLPPDPNGIDRVVHALDNFSAMVTRLGNARRLAADRQDQLAGAEREVDEATERHETAAEQAELSGQVHRERAEELVTLESSVGTEAAEVELQVATTQTEIKAAQQESGAAQKAYDRANGDFSRCEGLVVGATRSLRTAIEEAQLQAHRLAPFARADLREVLKLVGQPHSWPDTQSQWPDPAPLVDAAGSVQAGELEPLPAVVNQLLTDILRSTADLKPTESSLKSSRTRVSSSLAELQNQLSAAGHDYRPEWDSADDIIVVRVADEQGFTSIWGFATRISEARKDQELLLSESERRILEDALLGRLADQIHERTTDAKDLVARMNAEMRRRKMSSGATVGIGWELVDFPNTEQRKVSQLLDRSASRLSAEDLGRMRAHFAAQIKNLRAARPDRAYSEILAEALDYRRWRGFVLTLVDPDGSENRLTPARHSTLSGGEQSISVHLPLFAAAHVLLESANPDCPRLLALDEAFAGIDDPGRSELFGLTAQFDLDLFMTGYDLWATYATVPGCAHHDLAHSAIEHTVSSLLLVWDGSQILADAQIHGGSGDLAADLGSPGTRRRPGPGTEPALGADEEDLVPESASAVGLP